MTFMLGVLGSGIFWVVMFFVNLFAGTVIMKNLLPWHYKTLLAGHPVYSKDRGRRHSSHSYNSINFATAVLAGIFIYLFWPAVIAGIIVYFAMKIFLRHFVLGLSKKMITVADKMTPEIRFNSSDRNEE